MKFLTVKKTVSVLLASIIGLISFSALTAQETKFREKAWRVGINAAAQSNSACLGWQQLHNTDFNFHSPDDDIDLVDGTGWGAYIGIFGEYLSTSWWGLQFRMTYDNRSALVIDDTRTPIPSFDTKMSYLSFEPFLRIDQKLIPNLNFYAGPFLSVKLNSTYDFKYDQDQSAMESDIEVNLANSVAYGIQWGVAYDIKVSDFNYKTSMIVSPFFDWSWMANQKESVNTPDQNSLNDVWSTISYRLGIRLALEYRPEDEGLTTDAMAGNQKVFVVMPPDNTIVTKNIKGYFPIHPYVFFDKGNSQIPPRYTVLSTAEATNFKETDIANFVEGDLTVKEANVDQLMKSYYNVINIYADRMRRNPDEKLMLKSSDPDQVTAQANAQTIKDYMVNTFMIDSNRIQIVVAGLANPSGSANTETVSRGLIADENRRVVFEFNNANMLKPVPYTIRDESSIDNDMVFSISKSEMIQSWDITITGEGKSLYFGPYINYSERINPSELMTFLKSGKYNAKVTVTDLNNKVKEENLAFTLIKDSEVKNASRYLMLFEYNDANAVKSYESKIRGEIVPAIVETDRVIVHGHTDNIGTEAGNLLLSQQRADQAKRIIDEQLVKEDKNNYVEALGIGQSKNQYSFNNRYPEGRMYNRNIFVEIIK